jgi:hypothetical protein
MKAKTIGSAAKRMLYALGGAIMLSASMIGCGGSDSAPPSIQPETPVVPLTWKTAALMETATYVNGNASDITYNTLAGNAAGDAVLVYTKRDVITTISDLWVRRYSASSGLGAPLKISDGISTALDPQVAMNASGAIALVWRQYDMGSAGVASIRGAIYSGGSWGTPTTLDATSTQTLSPFVGIDDSGNAIAVWGQGFNGSGSQIDVVANRYTTSTPWTSATAVTIDSSPGRNFVSRLAMNGGGKAVVALRRLPNASTQQIGALRFDGSNWSAPMNVNAASSFAAGSRVGIDNAGNAMIVWQADTLLPNAPATRTDLFAASLSSSANTWITTTVDMPPATATVGNVNAAEIKLDGNGDAIAVWTRYRTSASSSGATLHASRLAFGASAWSVSTRLDTHPSGDVQNPSVAFRNGKAQVVWKYAASSMQMAINNQVWAAGYTSANGWAVPQTLWTSPSLGQLESPVAPLVISDDQGRSFASWETQNNTTVTPVLPTLIRFALLN